MKKFVITLPFVALAALLVAFPVGIDQKALSKLSVEKSTVVIFGGDMMFDRYIRSVSEQKGADYIFSCIKDMLASADVVVANLEGPITAQPSVSVGTEPEGEGNFTFTFPPATAELLMRHNIRIVNLANNHIENFGQEGVHSTKAYLEASEVSYFGPEPRSVFRAQLNGIPLTFISHSDFATDASTDLAVLAVREARQAGSIPIVYAHWGEEYVGVGEGQRLAARHYIDAGAELVIGSHPHVVQEVEAYQGSSIYYSLGNFVFDQYWNEEVRNGLLLEVTFTKSGVSSVREIPIELRPDGTVCLQRAG